MSPPGPRPNWADRIRPVWGIANRLEAAQLRRLGTSGMALLRRSPLLVVESVGRRTGRKRATPVAYWTGGQGEFYVGGGAAGMTRLPYWVANLRAHPAATVIVGRRRIAVIADELAGSEYEHARSHAVAIWPGVLRYERMSGRRVPYFRLSPNPKP